MKNHFTAAIFFALITAAVSFSSVSAEPSPRPPKIDHILLEVKDLDKSVAFYRDYFGLKLKDRSHDFVQMEAENIGVFLWSKHWKWSPLTSERKRRPQGMYPHLVISDVKGTMARLRQAGYEIVADAETHLYGTEGFVADPDGFVWALISK